MSKIVHCSQIRSFRSCRLGPGRCRMCGLSTTAVRSLLCPKGQALREAGMRAVKNHDAVSNATRLERRQDVRDRIAFLVRQEEEVLAEKRKRIEETLWAIHEVNIADFFETYSTVKRDHTGQPERTDEAGFRPKCVCGRSCWGTSLPKQHG